MKNTYYDESKVFEGNSLLKREISRRPPKIDIGGFDLDVIKEIASSKLQELLKYCDEIFEEESEIRFLAKDQLLNKNWFLLGIRQYCILRAKKDLQLWIKYWTDLRWPERLSKNTQFKTNLDLNKLRNQPIDSLCPGELRKIGSRLTGRCPFHNPEGNKEKSASFFIFEDNSFHCFSCQVHGSGAIDFLMKLKNIDFISAVHKLI